MNENEITMEQEKEATCITIKNTNHSSIKRISLNMDHNWDKLLQGRDRQFSVCLNFVPLEGLPMPDYTKLS